MKNQNQQSQQNPSQKNTQGDKGSQQSDRGVKSNQPNTTPVSNPTDKAGAKIGQPDSRSNR